jgi:hypothetical protein
MGLGSFFRSVVDRKFLGKEIVKKQIEIYYQQRNLYPDQSPHIHLAQVWLSRQAARGSNINTQEMQSLSYTETLLFACIPHPRCAEALGLYILYEERPDIPKDFPEFAMSYIKLLGPVIETKEKGNLEQLYQKYNPNMPEEYVEILFDRE